MLGDETATVKAFLWNHESLKEGNTVVIFKAVSEVVKEHIEVQLMERGKVDIARKEITKINKDLNVSDKEWVEQA